MICPNCEKNIPDDSKFCPNCGMVLGDNVDVNQPVNDQQMYNQPMNGQPMNGQPMNGQPVYGQQQMYGQPMYQQVAYVPVRKTRSPGSILADGIITLCLCAIPILGIICGIFTICAATSFHRAVAPRRSTQVTIGLVMGIIGLCIGATMTLVFMSASLS